MTGEDNPNNTPLSPFASREPTSPAPISSPPALEYPIYELSVERSRELDRAAIKEFGIPGIVLMENAARGMTDHALTMLRELGTDQAVICCGPGNNGGDGLAIARHLAAHQAQVTIVCAHDPAQYTGDARINHEIIRRMGIPVVTHESLPDLRGVLIIDALFGTGLTRPPGGVFAELICSINGARASGARVLAVDTPSGLDAQTGVPMDPCVTADRTVTLAALKPGFSSLDAQHTLGRVSVEDIGVPIELLGRLGTRVQGQAGRSGNSARPEA